MTAMDTIAGKRHGKPALKRQQRSGHVRKIIVAVYSTIDWLEGRIEKRRSRRALLELSDDQLKDVGISRADAYREGLRSFLD